MKMKTIIKFGVVAAFFASGCVPEDDAIHATSFENAATVNVPANIAYIKNVSEGAEIQIGLLGKSKAEEIKSVLLRASFIPADEEVSPFTEEELEVVNNYPETITIEEDVLLNLAGKNSVDDLNAGDRWVITYKVTLKNGKELTNGVKTNITFTCLSDFGGTYSFSTTDIKSGAGGVLANCGGTVTGTGTLTKTSNGIYKFSDNAFGLLICLYNDAPSVGTLTFNDVCGKVFWEGGDQYQDTYSLSITSNTGTALTFEWENTYGDGGTTTLTRTDGKTWPLDLYTE